MSELYAGHCGCGAVTVRIQSEVMGPYQCLCHQCQHVSGGGPATFVMAPRDKVDISGDIRSFAESTASGNKASRRFCGTCGTPVYSEPAKSSGLYAIKMSMFANPPWEAVKGIFWTSEKPAWYRLDPQVPQFDTQP